MAANDITVGTVCGAGHHQPWIRAAINLPNLCSSCSSIAGNINNLQQLVSNDGLKIVTTVQTLQDSIEAHRCRLCTIFLGIAIRSTWDEEMFVTSFKEFLSVYGKSAVEIRLQAYTKPEASRDSSLNIYGLIISGIFIGLCSKDPIGSLTLRFNVFASPDNPAAEFVRTRDYDRDMGSNAAYSQIQSWISACNENHPECKAPNQTRLPTRVLDLFIDDNPDHLKLIVTNGEHDHYVSLSYCWGGSQLLETTLSSLAGMCAHIEKSSLPLTIQDAITVTRQIGIRYLWVDSLCIVQDSTTDKETEISRMAEIYENSYLTIAAASAQGSNDGFLLPKLRPRCLEGAFAEFSFQLPFICPQGDIGTINLDYYLAWDSNISPEPLDRRGWAVQERLLSKRNLTYGTSTLAWCCNSRLSGWDSWLRQHHYSQLELGKFDKAPYTVWKRLVMRYSDCQLSSPEDMLPAISGLAVKFINKLNHPSAPDNYLAGIWESDMLGSLTWFTQPKDNGSVRDVSYRAPTWSWASVDCHINFSTLLYETASDREAQGKLEVICGHVTPKFSISPFGQVSSGYLKVRGRLIAGDNLPPTLTWIPGVGLGAPSTLAYKLDDFCYDEATVSIVQSSWLLQVQYRHGLVLEKIGDGRYKRIGYAATAHWENLTSELTDVVII